MYQTCGKSQKVNTETSTCIHGKAREDLGLIPVDTFSATEPVSNENDSPTVATIPIHFYL